MSHQRGGMFPQHSMSLPSGFRIHQTEPSTLHSTTSTTFSKTHYTSSPIGNPCSLVTTQVHIQEHLHLSSHTSSLPYQQNSEKHLSTSPSILVSLEYNQQPSTQAQTTSISNMPKNTPVPYVLSSKILMVSLLILQTRNSIV